MTAPYVKFVVKIPGRLHITGQANATTVAGVVRVLPRVKS